MFIEINLRKIKWLILGTYHPPNQPDDYFLKAVGNALDQYLKTDEKFLLLGDFNAEDTEPNLYEFLIITVLKSSFIKLKAKEMYYSDYKNFSTSSFREDLTLSLDRINKGFDSFEDTFMKNLNRHAPVKKKFVRAAEVPYMTKALRKANMERSELESKYLKNKSYQNIKNL